MIRSYIVLGLLLGVCGKNNTKNTDPGTDTDGTVASVPGTDDDGGTDASPSSSTSSKSTGGDDDDAKGTDTDGDGTSTFSTSSSDSDGVTGTEGPVLTNCEDATTKQECDDIELEQSGDDGWEKCGWWTFYEVNKSGDKCEFGKKISRCGLILGGEGDCYGQASLICGEPVEDLEYSSVVFMEQDKKVYVGTDDCAPYKHAEIDICGWTVDGDLSLGPPECDCACGDGIP